jgi:prevent-host-death family protein
MRTVPIVEMKSRLAALLADVARGEEIAITRHGKVIARLIPEPERMAAEAFAPLWESGEAFEVQAPDDLPASEVLPLD